MKNIFTLVFLSVYSMLQAQFAIIEDKDGETNVRDENSIRGQVVAKLPTNTIVSYYTENENEQWIMIEYKEEHDGYVFVNRLKPLDTFSAIKPETVKSNFVNFQTSDYQFIVSTKPFHAKEHEIYQSEGFVYAIDGKEFLGTDGNIPTNEIKSFNVLYKNEEIEISPEYFQSLYNLDLTAMKLTYNPKLNQYYLFGTFSDGAATFDALWVFEKGKLIQHISHINFNV